jgi:intergrase/recombinase
MRQHSMRALASLAKYRGCYPQWQEIIKAHQLTWSTGTDQFNAQWIESVIDGTGQIDEMLEWLARTCKQLPPVYANALACNVMTGLRVEENYECMRLLRTDRQNYVKEKDGLFLILHFKHPEIFFRPTKKAFLSILNKPAMELLETAEPVNPNALRLAQRHRKLPARSKWTRKIHNTTLKQAGLDSEVVDALSGRVPASVFQRHYLKSGLPYAKIEKAVNELWEKTVAPLVKTRL